MVCRWLSVACIILGSFGIAISDEASRIILLSVKGPIGPATADYIHNGVAVAEKKKAELIVLRMDTPGGLDLAMRNIIRDILASPVPVASFVAPSGARAASAGTYILYASHIAAMAPATTLGAATPIQVGGPPIPADPRNIKPARPEPASEKPEEQAGQKTAENPMQNKMVNDAAAYIRGLASLRDRNAEWAEQAVREAVSLSSDEAMQNNVIDMIARDVPDLLQQLHGRTVEIRSGQQTLHTLQATVEELEPDWRTRLLAVITNPNIAYILMLLGIYGLFFELANPGFVLPGVIGGICLLLALFAFQALPINYAGLGLILLGIAFMVGEFFAPSFGALGVGGIIAFAIGSVILMGTDAPGFELSLWVIASVTITSALFFMFVAAMAIRARKQPVVSGAEELVGAIGVACNDFDRHGRVHLHGETWQAETGTPVKKGQLLKVTGLNGLTLSVKSITTREDSL
ncbi:MAG: nodulation protein NfeD [Mariprofundaceae bacterium]|nr:nodulation protein NfeD [Mariprofundaceae bacterium]